MKNKILLFVLFIVLSGCGSSGFKYADKPAPVPLTVQMVSPNDQQTDVPLHPTIILQFNQTADHVNDTNITVREDSSTGNIVELRSIAPGNNNTYTVTPVAALTQMKTYYVVLTSGITGPSGQTLAPTEFYFTVGDFTAPTVKMIAPSSVDTKIPTSPVIQLQFDKEVRNVNQTTVALHKDSPTGDMVETGDFTLGSNHTYAFSPTENLQELTVYYVVLKNGIQDTSGNPLAPINFNFKTGDFTPPHVTMTPDHQATGVSRTPIIQLQFSKEVYGVEDNVTLHEINSTGRTVAINPIIPGGNHTYTFTPVGELGNTTTYYVMLQDGIIDSAGNALAPTNFYFTTGDFVAPMVDMRQPGNQSVGVSLHPKIVLLFSKAVTGVETNVTIREGSSTGNMVTISNIEAGNNNIEYTVNLENSLNESNKYYVVVTNGIQDQSGNPLEHTEFYFTTGDFTAPTLTYTSPKNGDTGVVVSPKIELQFSEKVQNINTTNLTLHEGSVNGSLLAIKDIATADSQTYTFYPNEALKQFTTYYIVLKDDIKDYSGNKLESTHFYFTTGALSWIHVGDSNSSSGLASGKRLALDKNGNPYVTYTDKANNNKITVKSYNKSENTWKILGDGENGFLADATTYVSLALDGNDIPYVAYSDKANGGKVTVKYYEKSNNLWYSVGSEGISTGEATYVTLDFDGNGIPYVAYSDRAHGWKAVVMKYNKSSNNWTLVGNTFASTTQANSISLALASDGNPYIAYEDIGNKFKATVMKYTGSHWESVGTAGFSSDRAFYLSLAMDKNNNIPYVAYSDATNQDKAVLMKYNSNGNTWEIVGGTSLSEGRASYTNLAFSAKGVPYVAYIDEVGHTGNPSDYQMTVMQYDGLRWSLIGNRGFSLSTNGAGFYFEPSLAIDGQGVPHVAYGDNTEVGLPTAYNVTVMKADVPSL